MTNTFICTVGGSHQPIVRAISDLQPERVLFVCSEDDKETGNKGSYISVTGKGNVNKSSPKLPKADLPNIITLARLSENQTEIIKVPSDDLSGCYFEIQQAIRNIELSSLVANYTGGTKTMSAALAMIAADHNIQLNLVVGTRADHVKVKNGSEESMPLDIDHLRYQRAIKPIALLWNHYSYHQAQTSAENILQTIKNKASRKLFIQISKAFAAWDRFDHRQAADILENYRPKIARYYAGHLTVLKHLIDAVHPENKVKYTPYQIYDVWNSAERKATQGYYDDAIARAYRVLEWTAQWILLKEKDWKTGDLPDRQFPEEITITSNRRGQKQAGLYAAWQLLELHAQEPVQAFVKAQLETMMHHLQVRNNSILAHGFETVNREQWQALHIWMTEHFLPMLQEQARLHPYNIKLKPEDMQLPDTYPEELLNP